MHHTLRQGLTTLVTVATFALFALATGQAQASGGDDFSQNIFAPESSPTTQDLPHYASGQIGIVPGSYWRVYLFLAYRAASGQPLTPADLESLNIQGWKIGAIKQAADAGTEAAEPLKTWLAARKSIAGAAAINLTVTKYDEVNYVEHLNCADDALRRASTTLTERLRSGELAWVRVWLANQDAVFANCGLVTRVRGSKPKPVSPMPAALPGDAPAWLRKDHAYQTAAALFYAGQFEVARQQFLAIAKDKASPWSPWGEYLAARCLIRKATLDRGGESSTANAASVQAENQKWRSQLEQARTELTALAPTFPAAQGLLGWVDARIRPQARLAELASTLSSGRFTAASPRQLADYLLIWDTIDTTTWQAQEPLTQWMAAMQGERETALATALQHWKAKGETLWLMPLLAQARKGDLSADALKAAAEVQPGAPAYVHLQYHLARLEVASGKSAEADQRTSTLLQHTGLSVATRNRLLGIKMVTAATREGFFQAAARKPAEPDAVGPITSETTPAAPQATDSDYPRHLYRHFSLAELQKALPLAKGLQSTPLSDVLWTRAVILGDYAVADSVTADVMVGRDTTHPLYRRYLEAKDAATKRDAALLILVNAPEFNANIGADTWGCGAGGGAGGGAADTNALDAAWPRFLSEEARTQAKIELQKLRALPKRSDYLGPLLLDYAQRNPVDAEVPKALHFFIASTRMECSYSEKPKGQKSYSQQAFEWLKKRYPGNEWAARTKYYY